MYMCIARWDERSLEVDLKKKRFGAKVGLFIMIHHDLESEMPGREGSREKKKNKAHNQFWFLYYV